MIRSENIAIPLIIGCVLIIGSFVPVLQIIMLQGNGAFMYPFDRIGDNVSESTLNYLNLFFGFFCLIAFYLSEKLGYKVLWAVLTTFFLQGFIFLLEMEFTKGGDTSPYFLAFIIAAILTILPLIIVGYLKEKKEACT